MRILTASAPQSKMRFGGDVRQQIGQAAGLSIVVAAQLIGQQKAGVGTAGVAGFYTEFRIERMALACGVRTLVTTDLNSPIMEGVISLTLTPRADASDFCKLPR